MTLDTARRTVSEIMENGRLECGITAAAVGEINAVAREYADCHGLEFHDARYAVAPETSHDPETA